MPPVDEGMIHAWLDGALSVVEAERIERLVASDPAWSAAAAEARGLIAASSRILSQLDAVPARVAPAAIPTVSAAREQLRIAKVEPRAARRWRPQLWAAAATVVMAVGAGVLWKSTPDASRSPSTAVAVQDQPSLAKPDTVPSSVAIAPAASQQRAPSAGVTGGRQLAAGVGGASSAGATASGRTGNADRASDSVSDRASDRATKATASAARVASGAGLAVLDKSALPAETSGFARNAPVAEAADRVAPVEKKAAATPPRVAQEERRAEPAVRREVAKANVNAVDAAGAPHAMRSAMPMAGRCYTVRLSEWSPSPSFAVPVGVLLDSVRAGSAFVARALVGGDAPPPPPGTWNTIGDSVRVTIDGVVLGYGLRATVARSLLAGRATLGDAAVPVRASATATMQPSRCPAP